jgi:hypothetical protein
MSEDLTVEITEKQRAMLLDGLKFVRSSLMLTAQEPTPDAVSQRNAALDEVQELVDRLNGTPTTASVS